VEFWQSKDPIKRFRAYLMQRGLLTDEQDQQLIAAIEEEINEAVQTAEAMPAMAPDSFFDNTFAEPFPRLQEQRAELSRYIKPE
jgi:TPP-dependent pyruvate/acetoin dehydrogenase alpha subunit